MRHGNLSAMRPRAARLCGWIQLLSGAAVFAVIVHRAATRVVWIDEAFTFNKFVHPPLADAFRFYDANNHLLFTLLARASVALLPPGEFALRLPAVLGAALRLAATALAVRRLLRRPVLAAAAFLLLILHPMTLEYMHSARGYSLALGFWLLAVALAAGGLERAPFSFPRALGLGALLGLSFSAHAAFAIPAAAAGVALLVVRLAARERAAWRETAGLAAGAALTGLPAALYLLLKAGRSNFYFGNATLAGSLQGLVDKGLYFIPTPVNTPGTAWGYWLWISVQELSPAVLSVLIVAGGALAIAGLRRIPARSCKPELFTAAMSGACLAAVVALHHILQLPYPEERTGLYLIPLAVIGACQGCQWLLDGGWLRRAAAAVPAVFAGVYLLHFAFCLPVTWQNDAKFSAGDRALVEAIARQPRGEGARTLGGNWLLCEGVNYYRTLLGLHWLRPMDRSGPEGGFDFYVLLEEDLPVVQRKNLRILFRHPLAGSYLAIPQR